MSSRRGRRSAGALPASRSSLYRGQSGQVFALEDRCAHRQVPLHLGVVSGDELKCHYHGWAYDCTGKCVSVPYLGKERLPNGVKSYPVREVDGLIFVFPGDPALAEARLPAALGASQRKDYKTRRLNREVACHYTFMHENLFDMNHQFMHRKQMGSIRASCLGREHGEDWAQVEYSFSRTGGQAVRRRAGHRRSDAQARRGEEGLLRPHAHSHRLPHAEPQGLGRAQHPGERRSGARRLARLYAARRRAAHQPHLWLSVREEAADSRA